MIDRGAVRQLLGAAATVLIGAGIAWADPPMRVTACGSDTQAGAGLNLAQALGAGGEIQFSCPAGTTIRVTGRYPLKQNTVIDGGDTVTLDGHGSFGPMLTSVSSANVILRRITFRGFAQKPPPPPGGGKSLGRIPVAVPPWRCHSAWAATGHRRLRFAPMFFGIMMAAHLPARSPLPIRSKRRATAARRNQSSRLSPSCHQPRSCSATTASLTIGAVAELRSRPIWHIPAGWVSQAISSWGTAVQLMGGGGGGLGGGLQLVMRWLSRIGAAGGG